MDKKIVTEEIEQKLKLVVARCPKCDIGYVIFTGRVGNKIQGAPPKAEHVCSNCGDISFLEKTYPNQRMVNMDGSKNVIDDAIETLNRKNAQKQTSNLIIPA